MEKATAEDKAKKLTKDLISEEFSYAQSRSWGHVGFSSFYLFKTKKAETMTTTAQLTFLMTLAACDLTLGTSMAELVFNCCKHAPVKAFVVALMTLATTKNKARLIEDIFDYRSKNGSNCLMITFDMAAGCRHKNNKCPDPKNPMMIEIEETVLCLIQLGEQHGVDMDAVLNAVPMSGSTLFHRATLYSERVARLLLTKNVRVNAVDGLFQTVTFRVSQSESSIN